MINQNGSQAGGGKQPHKHDRWGKHKMIFIVILFLAVCVALNSVLHLHHHLPKRRNQHRDSHRRWVNGTERHRQANKPEHDGGRKKWREEQAKAGVNISAIPKSGWAERYAKSLNKTVDEVEEELRMLHPKKYAGMGDKDKGDKDKGDKDQGEGGGQEGEGTGKSVVSVETIRKEFGASEGTQGLTDTFMGRREAGVMYEHIEVNGKKNPMIVRRVVKDVPDDLKPLPPDVRNPLVLELAQGRSGSTITGNLVLKSHPYCGQFIDELVWVMYRLLLAFEFEKDQSLSIDYFLNTTQCDLKKAVWDDLYSKDWLFKREMHSEGENSTLDKDSFSRAAMHAVCKNLHKLQPAKAVCSKELRFLGHVKALMEAASERKIPLVLLYQLRDPRAVAFSQIWTFHRGDHTQDIGIYGIRRLRSACKIGAEDLKAIREPPPGVQAQEICFEDLIHRPQITLKKIYGSIPGFANWPTADPDSLLTPETEAYGREHINHWDEAMKNAHLTEEERRAGQGNVWMNKKSYDRYSSEKSRSDHVHVWKEAWPFIKYDGMRSVWNDDPNCIELRRISNCSHLWPEMPLNQTARNIMFSSWGKVPVSMLDDPDSWISKAMQLKIEKSLKMLKEADRKDSLGGVDEENVAAQIVRWLGGTGGGLGDDDDEDGKGDGKGKPGGGTYGDGHSKHWHEIHDSDASGSKPERSPHPKHASNSIVLQKKGVAVDETVSHGMGRRNTGGTHPLKKKKDKEGKKEDHDD